MEVAPVPFQSAPARHGLGAWPLLVAGSAYVLALAGVVWGEPLLAAASAILLVGAWLLDVWGRTAARLVPAWLLLWLLVPLPVQWREQVLVPLQDASAREASLLLDFVHLDHLLAKRAFELPGRRYPLADVSTGTESLFVLLALSCVFIVYVRRRPLSAVLLLAAVVAWAVVSDILSVLVTVAAWQRLEIDLSANWLLLAFRAAGLVFALLMIFCSDRLLAFLLDPASRRRSRRLERKSATDGPSTQAAPQMPLAAENRVDSVSSFGRWVLAGLFALTVGAPAAVAVITGHSLTWLEATAK